MSGDESEHVDLQATHVDAWKRSRIVAAVGMERVPQSNHGARRHRAFVHRGFPFGIGRIRPRLLIGNDTRTTAIAKRSIISHHCAGNGRPTAGAGRVGRDLQIASVVIDEPEFLGITPKLGGDPHLTSGISRQIYGG